MPAASAWRLKRIMKRTETNAFPGTSVGVAQARILLDCETDDSSNGDTATSTQGVWQSMHTAGECGARVGRGNYRYSW